MNIRNWGTGLLAAMTFGTLALTPLTASAQRDRDRDRNEWRNREQEAKSRREDNRDRRDWQNNNRYHRNDRNRDWRDSGRGDWQDRQYDRRQQTKNEWRNIAIGSGALGILGLLNRDNTLTFAGAAGALYSLNRYEQDRRSQSQLNRARSSYFSKPYFYRDGVRYERRTVTRNGQRYYQFVRR